MLNFCLQKSRIWHKISEAQTYVLLPCSRHKSVAELILDIFDVKHLIHGMEFEKHRRSLPTTENCTPRLLPKAIFLSVTMKVKKQKQFKYIYGPVSSWRLGSSLGVDLLSQRKKICSFDCIYCQLGATKTRTDKRELYVPTEKAIEEIKVLPKLRIDYITFSGRGEPTLAINLGEAIKAVKKIRQEPIAVLTNASLLDRRDVRKELSLADLVAVKLDAASQDYLKLVNRPAKNIKFSAILRGIKQFRKEYQGKLALQVMLMRENEGLAKDIAKLAKDIRPDEIQINTPSRPSPVGRLSRKAILDIKRHFSRMNVTSLDDAERKKVRPVSAKDTISRRGKKLE